MFRTRFSFSDLCVILSVLALSAALLIFPKRCADAGSRLAVRTPEGETVYSLAEDREIVLTSQGVTLKITVCAGCAYVSETDCSDRLCLNTGKISRVGETIVCAPAAVRLTVTDAKGGVGDADLTIG